ncbi:MAG: hypothetical protein ACK4K7_03195 [Allosphingosinicella sp.]
MMRLIPLVERYRWGGDMDDGRSSVAGWSISFAWLGFYVEFIVAREQGK